MFRRTVLPVLRTLLHRHLPERFGIGYYRAGRREWLERVLVFDVRQARPVPPGIWNEARTAFLALHEELGSGGELAYFLSCWPGAALDRLLSGYDGLGWRMLGPVVWIEVRPARELSNSGSALALTWQSFHDHTWPALLEFLPFLEGYTYAQDDLVPSREYLLLALPAARLLGGGELHGLERILVQAVCDGPGGRPAVRVDYRPHSRAALFEPGH